MKRFLSRRALGIGLAGAMLITLAGVSAPAMAAPAASSIKITSVKQTSGSNIMAGGAFYISGTTSTSLRGQWLKLQVKQGSSWASTTVGARVSSTGTFAIPVKGATLGSVAYRAVYWGSSIAQKAYSATATATAYRWTQLSRTKPKSSRILQTTAVDINGTNYPNSLLLPRNNGFDGSAVYDLKRKCVRFRSTAGVPDTQPITGRALANILLDGNVAFSQVLVGGHSYKIDMSLSNILELRLERDYTSSAYHDLAFGDASVLCSF